MVQNMLPQGFRVGRYEIDRLLGAGQVGATYLARDIGSGAPVAIKELILRGLALRADDGSIVPITAEDAEPFERCREVFVDEARALAAIKHPNLVRTLDVFAANGTAYAVMEPIDGASLSELIQAHGALSAGDTGLVIDALLDALAAIHAAGRLHLEVTPMNILADLEGRPVLLGSARVQRALALAKPVLGGVPVPRYAAFEQYDTDDQSLGPWTDIYGLAATARRLVGDAVPEDAVARLNAATQGDADPCPPLAALAPAGYAPAFLAALDAGFAVMPADRPQSIADWRARFPLPA